MQLTTLGGLVFEDVAFTRPKPLLVLAYLVLEGPTGRRDLADLFFPETIHPRDSLTTALRLLRRVPGGAVEVEGDRVIAHVACDATLLLQHLDAFRYEQGIEIYQGAFLAGFDLEVSEELEEWIYGTREALARRVRAAHIQIARSAVAQGEVVVAGRAAEQSLHVVGAPELDIAEIRILVPILEHAVSPEAGALRELAADYGLVLPARPSGDVAFGSAYPTILPSHLLQGTPFVGRERELAAMLAHLKRQDSRLMTIYGMGGIGKTRLVARLVDALQQYRDVTFPEGIFFVALEDLDMPSDVLPAIARVLGLPIGATQTLETLAEMIKTWRCLLLLDNFEHLMEAAQDVLHLMRLCTGLDIIVTSRTRLALSEEYSFRLSGLATVSIDATLPEATQLFRDRARRIGFDMDADSETLEVINEICQQLEGYPLGIELAANLTRLLPLAEIRAELRTSIEMLIEGSSDAPQRHKTVRAAFEPSWKYLEERERQVLKSLSVFRGGFQRDAAARVAGATLQILSKLTDKALLRADPTGAGRFDFHPLLLSFIRAKATAGEQEAAIFSHQVFYRDLLDSCAIRISEEPRQILDRLEIEIANILHAAKTALEGEDEQTGSRIMGQLVVDCDFLQARGARPEMLDLVERAATVIEGHADHVLAHHMFTRLGDARRELLGDLDTAQKAYRRAFALAELTGDKGRQAILLCLIGALAEELDGHVATEYMQQARSLAEEAGDDLAVCSVLQKWGYLAAKDGDWQLVRQLCNEALEIARPLKDIPGVDRAKLDQAIFYSLHNLGVAEDYLGRLEKSLEYRRQALDIANDRDHQLWRAYASEEVGIGYNGLTQRDLAQQFFSEALELYERNKAVVDKKNLEARLLDWGYLS